MSRIYVLGSVNMDMVITTPYMPKNGETINGGNFFLNAGGKGANQAVAASKQEKEVLLIAKLGDDVFGNELFGSLINYGVNVENVLKELNASTGVAMIVIENKDNRIILDGGTNKMISNKQIDSALSNAKENDIFITQLENNIDAVYYGLKTAHNKKMKTIFNPAPAIKLDDEVYKYVDYLIINETECEILTGINPDTFIKKKEAYNVLKNKGIRTLIITLGSKGSIAFTQDEYVEVDSNKVEVKDTTAAGDTYVGTLASRLLEGSTLKESMEYASICSSLTCMTEGAQKSIPTKKQVDEYLESLKEE